MRNRLKTSTREQLDLLLGIGLDGNDGHKRFTRGRNFCLIGGSHDTHGWMQDKMILFNQELDRRIKRLCELSEEEFQDIVRKIRLMKG